MLSTLPEARTQGTYGKRFQKQAADGIYAEQQENGKSTHKNLTVDNKILTKHPRYYLIHHPH
jgi:hypothetical protein